jgi:two-component system, LytTR family, sensor kinase
MAAKHGEFQDFYFRLVATPLVGFLIPPIFFHFPIENTFFFWHEVFFATFYTTLYWQVCRWIIVRINRRFTEPKDNLRRLFWIIVPSVASILTLCNFIHYYVDTCLQLDSSTMPPILQINAASLVSFVAITSMYEAMRYAQLWQQTVMEKEQLAKVNLQSQLEGLKSQVNPHFLFNSLNTLTHLIPEAPEKAVRFVQQLSKVYRYVLEMRDASTIPLVTELTFLEAYIFLLQERFGDNFRTTIAPDIHTFAQHHIVPLSLQIVFENAVKHNIISAEKPLLIELFVEKNKLVVRNNLQRKNQIQIGTGMGLDNIKSRYQLVSQQQMEVIVTAKYFMVLIPLLEKNTQ